MEEAKAIFTESGVNHPVIFIPKKCTTLEINCNLAENVFINVSLTTRDTDGALIDIYAGLCIVKVIDSYDLDIQDTDYTGQSSDSDSNSVPIVTSDDVNQTIYPDDSQSQLWMDPEKSPYMFNGYNIPEAVDQYSIYRQTRDELTVEQYNTCVTQNVYNCNESVRYSPLKEIEHKKIGTVDESDYNHEANDKLECGVFLSQLPQEIMLENESKALKEIQYIGLQSENHALKQLMSSDIQSSSKQQRTILYLGHNSNSGQTIQNIAVNDPMLVCADSAVDNEVVIDSKTNENVKKYQCDKCKQIFYQITDFKRHIQGNHGSKRSHAKRGANGSQLNFLCTQCGKTLKSQEKFELHCLGHGDPNLECSKCHKVFASKFTLRNHHKLHLRSNRCSYCPKSYYKMRDLKKHLKKMHFLFKCGHCDYGTQTCSDLLLHKKEHRNKDHSSGSSATSSLVGNETSSNDAVSAALEAAPSGRSRSDFVNVEHTPEPDSVIAKVMSSKIFLVQSNNEKRSRRKTCNVCYKRFDRVSDLKRHLIEHVIRSTLAKMPVNMNGTISIPCEVCRNETFSKIDKYKAHLREHAKLTLYKCIFCDKSFSDSSNFSKHKKVHDTTLFQCDLCQRKFNSKKMLIRHMEYHNSNTPMPCYYCGMKFHFLSMLKKHIKLVHSCEIVRIRCSFCSEQLTTLKQKWDHEWYVHKVRKMIVDCLLCGYKFRKYSELKRHCKDVHSLNIPPAKSLLKKRKSR